MSSIVFSTSVNSKDKVMQGCVLYKKWLIAPVWLMMEDFRTEEGTSKKECNEQEKLTPANELGEIWSRDSLGVFWRHSADIWIKAGKGDRAQSMLVKGLF